MLMLIINTLSWRKPMFATRWGVVNLIRLCRCVDTQVYSLVMSLADTAGCQAVVNKGPGVRRTI